MCRERMNDEYNPDWMDIFNSKPKLKATEGLHRWAKHN